MLSGLALALSAAVCWSLYDLTRRFLSAKIPALTLVYVLTAGAVPIVVLWALVSGTPRVTAAYFVPGLASTALNLVANWAFFRSLELAPLSVTIPLLATTPAFAALLAALFLAEPVSDRSAFGILLVVLGALVMAARGSVSRDVHPQGAPLPAARAGRLDKGALLMLLVAALWAAALLFDKVALGRASAPVHAFVLNAGVALGARAMLAWRREKTGLALLRGRIGLVSAAILAGTAAIALQLLAIRIEPIGFVETLKRAIGGTLAVVWGRAFFSEPVNSRKILAVALLAAGVALIMM